MARQSSKGTCTFCHKEFSKASMTRHLASCEQRSAMQAQSDAATQVRTVLMSGSWLFLFGLLFHL